MYKRVYTHKYTHNHIMPIHNPYHTCMYHIKYKVQITHTYTCVCTMNPSAYRHIYIKMCVHCREKKTHVHILPPLKDGMKAKYCLKMLDNHIMESRGVGEIEQ